MKEENGGKKVDQFWEIKFKIKLEIKFSDTQNCYVSRLILT